MSSYSLGKKIMSRFWIFLMTFLSMSETWVKLNRYAMFCMVIMVFSSMFLVVSTSRSCPAVYCTKSFCSFIVSVSGSSK